MAIVEDYIPDSDDEDFPHPPAQDPPIPEPPSQQANGGVIKGSTVPELVELLRVPREFNDTLRSKQLTVAEAEAHQRRIKSALQQLADLWSNLDENSETVPNESNQEDTKVYIAVTRLRGIINGPDGNLVTPEILQLVEKILKTCSKPSETAHALLLDLKSIFASKPHPEISAEGRRLMRPVGGEAGRSDLFDEQSWKEAWGTWNTLRWCVEVISTQDLIGHIPIILPPLLIQMDDYKSSYRIRGLQIIPAFLRLPVPVLKRTGIAQLLLRSIQHSISLHPTPPEPPLLEPAMEQLFHLLRSLFPVGGGEEAEAANHVGEAVEKGIVNGWAYARSGQEGAEALVGIARAVEMVCVEVGLGVIRWMRTFIPSLLSPLLMPPIPYIIPVQVANLRALHVMLVTIEKTGRAARWRGEILDGVGRMVVALHERGVVPQVFQETSTRNSEDSGEISTNGVTVALDSNGTAGRQAELKALSKLCGQIFDDLIRVVPSMKETEIPALLALDPNAFDFLHVYQDGSESTS